MDLKTIENDCNYCVLQGKCTILYSILHTIGHFRVKSTGRHGVYKFQNVAQPECYLGYVDGFIVGYVSTFVAMEMSTRVHRLLPFMF